MNGSLEAQLLVGAGGHFCPVARALGADFGRGEHAVSAQELEFELDPGTGHAAGAAPELFFCADLNGYAWVFRKGRYLNVGLGREDPHRLGEHVEQFCAFLRARGTLPAGLPGRFRGHAYLLYPNAQRPLVAERALLVGDAAGLAYAQSGEGIRPAVESALLAAGTIIAARGRYGRTQLAPYADAIAARFGARRARQPSRAGRVKSWLGRRLLANGWFARHVVLDRWFLHARDSALGA